jgi:hypothetical protein
MASDCDCDIEQDVKPGKPNNYISGGWLLAIGGFALAGLVAIAWLGIWLFDKGNERATFISAASINVLILAAVLLQAFIYRRQWDAMQSGLNLTLRSIKAGKQTSIDAQRAYVVAKIKDTGPYDEGFQFRLIIENGGNTPANNVCVHYWCDFGDPPWRMQPVGESPPNEPIKQAIFETTKGGTTERLGVIGPKGSQVFTTMPPILLDMSAGSEASQRFDSGKAKFYCWGTIAYEDMFKKARLSHFCFSLWRKTANGYLSFEQIETGYPCEHGNYVT